MNSATFSGIARTGLVVIVLVLAIVAGLAVGNAINGRDGTLNSGYPAGWRGGAAVPVSRVADTSFSLDAVQQLQAIRGDAAAPAFIDYGLRHALAPRSGGATHIDYVDQARQRSAATDPVEKPAPAPIAPGL